MDLRSQRSLEDVIDEKLMAPEWAPMLFEIGQKVRVKVGVVDDGQTPAYWGGAECTVIDSWVSPVFKDPMYILEHIGTKKRDSFRESELDLRYIRY